MIAGLVLFAAASGLTWRSADGGRFELMAAGKPVMVYNAGMQLANGAPADKRRCCYVHPVYAPNGVVVTDDFPKDHWHHRGIFWAWPRVIFEGTQHDMWMLRGAMVRRSVSVAQAGPELRVENGWFLDGRKIVRERVRIRAESASRIRFDLEFEALEAPVQLVGAPENNKGYGGFSVRFAPRQNTVIRTDLGVESKDTDMVPHAWAELTGDYQGGRATLRIDDSRKNGWCLRNYGFLGVNYPGLEPAILSPGTPLQLSYTVTITAP
jgi:hypothetical protein